MLDRVWEKAFLCYFCLSCDFRSFLVTLLFEFQVLTGCLDSGQGFLWFWFVFREVVLRAFQTELRFHLKLNPMRELNKIFILNHMFGPSVIQVRCTCEYFVLWWRWRSVFSLRKYLLSFIFNELNISFSTQTSLNLFFQLKFFMA